MMTFDVERLFAQPVNLFTNQWLVLCAGDAETYNMMTIAWGSIGCMWNKPFVQVAVRPQRHTYGFMEKYDTFSLSAFAESYRNDLQVLGSRSGRDGDKLAHTSLTPLPGRQIPCPAFAEASLVLECVQIYYHDFEPDRFLDPEIQGNYRKNDYHRVYAGEIVSARAEKSWIAP